MSEADGAVCGDNRFEVIGEAKRMLLEGTNIESSADEMKVLDSFLFRCWQMGWLHSVEQKLENERKEPQPPSEEPHEYGLVAYARAELKRIEDACEDGEARDMQRLANDDILSMVRLFCEQGHSYLSSEYVLNRFRRLSRWKPLTPLTGEDDEWSNAYDKEEQTQQNKRYSALFRRNHDNSTASRIDDVAFSDDGGITWWTSGWLKKAMGYEEKITFPYMPPDEPREVYIKYTKFDKDGNPDMDSWVDITNDKEEIKRLHDERRAELDKAYKEEEEKRNG